MGKIYFQNFILKFLPSLAFWQQNKYNQFMLFRTSKAKEKSGYRLDIAYTMYYNQSI